MYTLSNDLNCQCMYASYDHWVAILINVVYSHIIETVLLYILDLIIVLVKSVLSGYYRNICLRCCIDIRTRIGPTTMNITRFF